MLRCCGVESVEVKRIAGGRYNLPGTIILFLIILHFFSLAVANILLLSIEMSYVARLLTRHRSSAIAVCCRYVRTRPGATASNKVAKKPLPIRPPPPLPTSNDVASTWSWVPPRQEAEEVKSNVVPVIKG